MKERQENMNIDLGANLLPGFADSAGDGRTCAKRISALHSAGIVAAVLTPRYYPAKRSVEDFIAFRSNILHNFMISAPKERPVMYLGCEVYIDERLKYISTISKLTVYGTNTIIAYMPEGKWEGSLIDTLDAIRAVGIDVVIAHIDRYPEQYAEDLFEYGYRAIIDASAFVGISNFFRRDKLLSWIDEGYIVGIGSNFVEGKNWIIRLISKVVNLFGYQINFKADENKKLTKMIARVNAIIGEERAAKLDELSAKALAGAVQITN